MEEAGRQLNQVFSFPAGSKNGHFHGLLAHEHRVLVGRPLTTPLAAANTVYLSSFGLGLAWAEAGSP